MTTPTLRRLRDAKLARYLELTLEAYEAKQTHGNILQARALARIAGDEWARAALECKATKEQVSGVRMLMARKVGA
jgi:hypothetical protein